MKYVLIIALVGVVRLSWAGECIIDPQKVMVHSSSEPLFLPPEEKQREVASQSGEGHGYSRRPDEYLDVLKSIPKSEPLVQRVWLEYRILRED